MTDSNKFRTLAKDKVCKLEKELYGREITHEDIQVVFQAYILGQMKATMVVARNTDGRYYEISYSFINNKLFVDVYKKIDTRTFEVEE